MDYCWPNDNESNGINFNKDDKQIENSENDVYSESGCAINYESEETLDFTKDCAKKSEEDKESSLTEEFNQLHLEWNRNETNFIFFI